MSATAVLVLSTVCDVELPAVTDTIASSTTLPDGAVTVKSRFVPASTVSVYVPCVFGFVVALPTFTVSVVKSVIAAA